MAIALLSACGGEHGGLSTTSGGTAGSGGGGGATSSGGASTGGSGAVQPPAGSTADFGVLEITDVHTNLLSYDYFKLAPDESIGLERTATLIADARKELPNDVLVDDGDTIQGTVLADYQALVKPVGCDQPLAVYKVLNHLGVDVGGIGNHEFNYGLPFLSQVTHTPFDVPGLDLGASAGCEGPAFPQVLSNVFSVKTHQTIFPNSALLTRTITATGPDGKPVTGTLRIGFLGITPPTILSWDKKWLDGEVDTRGVQEVAAPIVQGLRAAGADIVVAVVHGGLDDSPYVPTMENQAWYMAQVPGIDAMLMGHSHQVFPDAASTAAQFNLPLVDKVRGTVNGVPSVMASFWGQRLGVIELRLTYDGKAWRSDPAKAIVEARPITTSCKNGLPAACDAMERWATGARCAFATACAGQPDGAKVHVAADPAIAPLIAAEHQATIGYVTTPIGTSDFEMSTFFADVGDVTALEIVNQAQADYVAASIQNDPALKAKYGSLPVLSVAAPFKSGFQGGNDYTDVLPGSIAIRDAANLYLFPNTVQAVKVTGADLLAWLETTATRFRQIDPNALAPQPLLNPGQPGFDFDVFTDPRISYEIDVTRPLPSMGMPASGRIKDLSWNGQPMDMAADFIVATNNYRASGGGGFPGLDGTKTILSAPDTNRDVLIKYIQKLGILTRLKNGSDRSWRFTKVTTQGPVIFRSAQNALPRAQAAGLANISLVQQDDGSGKGLSVYAIDLSQ
jgi:2',3'-cyclic-nucleotide 2'-phosphodiesterase/3'-nucleotidase